MDPGDGPAQDTSARGRQLADLLAGAWRPSPPALSLTPAALETVVPLLARGGAGGLAWHRLRHTLLHASPACRELRQHYRLQSLRAVAQAESVAAVLARCRAAGVEPILIKGWSVARLYPEPGLRPSGDIDLCVRADQFQAALHALDGLLPCAVDLHCDVPDLPERSWDAVFRRSQMAILGETSVRLLGAEDQLRLLCLHLARHGLARPLGLCDIGACLESLPAGFDWDYCLRGRPHLTAWVRCVLGLACQLLGAGAVQGRPGDVPRWVEQAVLWCWGAGSGRETRHSLRHPGEVMRRLRYHGLSPKHGSQAIKDALCLGLRPSPATPLLLVQLAGFVRRKAPYIVRRLFRRRRPVAHPLTIHRH